MSETVQATPTTEVVSNAAPSAPVNFDQMESLTNNWRSSEPVAEPKAEKAAEPEADEVEGDEAEEAPKAAKAEKEEKAEPKEDAKAKEAKAEKKPSKVKVKAGEQTIELGMDAMIPVKIDGKVVEVPVSDVLGSYSSQKQRDRLFHEFSNQKKQFETERQKISDVVNKSYEMLAQKKDLRGFIEYMSEALGVDGQKLYNDSVENIRQTLEADSQLTPEERRLKALEEEKEFYRSKLESQRMAEAKTKEMKQLETQVETILTETGMQKADFVKAYDELVQAGLSQAEITPEAVKQFHKNRKLIDGIESKLKAVNPEAATLETIEHLASLAIKTELNSAEIDEVVETLYGNVAEKKLANKVKRTLKTKQKEMGNRNAGSSPNFFDDLAF